MYAACIGDAVQEADHCRDENTGSSGGGGGGGGGGSGGGGDGGGKKGGGVGGGSSGPDTNGSEDERLNLLAVFIPTLFVLHLLFP